jgi:hypothetical protein
MQSLNIAGRKAHFLLQTMGQQKVVPAFECSDLEVSGLESNLFYNLPDLFIQNKIPVIADFIVIEGDLAKLPNLSNIRIPSIRLMWTC